MTYVITEGCIDIKDRLCLDQCPVECIFEGDRMMYIHPDLCINCGACEPACPQGAIAREEDVEAHLFPFIAINRDFSSHLSEDELGGEAVHPDHPEVRAYPADRTDGR